MRGEEFSDGVRPRVQQGLAAKIVAQDLLWVLGERVGKVLECAVVRGLVRVGVFFATAVGATAVIVVVVAVEVRVHEGCVVGPIGFGGGGGGGGEVFIVGIEVVEWIGFGEGGGVGPRCKD